MFEFFLLVILFFAWVFVRSIRNYLLFLRSNREHWKREFAQVKNLDKILESQSE